MSWLDGNPLEYRLNSAPSMRRWEDINRRIKENIIINENNCWIWQKSKYKNGYARISFMGKYHLLHRLSYVLYKGNIEPKNVVCHSCDVRNCVNPDHLWTGTYKENSQDMVKKGRIKNQFGEKNSRHRMTNEKIIEFKKLRENGYSLKKLAKLYNIGYGTAQAISSGRTWNKVGI
jgi:hypothetical protein